MREFIEKCIAAVEAEISAAKNGGNSTRSIKVVNGTFVRQADKSHVYRFVATTSLPVTYEDAPVVLTVEGNRIGGSVIGMHDCDVTLAMDEYLGTYVAEAQLVIDLTFILERLREALSEKTDTLATAALVRKAFGNEHADVTDGPLDYVPDGLNPQQESVLKKCVGSDFLMIWGPPGTGKTHVLARFLREQALAGRTTLLVSNTNIAVDQALGKFLEIAETDDALRGLLEAGKFVRLGAPQLAEVDSLILDKVLEKINADTRQLLGEKESALVLAKARVSESEALARLVRNLTALRQKVDGLKTNYSSAKAALDQARVAESVIGKDLRNARTELEALLERRGVSALFAKMRVPAAEQLVAGLNKRSVDASLLAQRQLTRFQQTEQALEKATVDLASLETSIGKSNTCTLESVEVDLKRFRDDVRLLEDQIKELSKRLADVRERVVKDALVVACTCAKTALDKSVASASFDAVVTDESSMISLPQSLWCAGLARSRFICCGDFRQLPPISSIDREKCPENHVIMSASIFDYLGINRTQNDYRLAMLEQQYRMPDAVCRLVSKPMYGGRLITGRHDSATSNPLTMITTSGFNAWSDKTENFSWFNWHHAFVAVELVRQLLAENSGDTELNICIMAPYRAQVELINVLLKEANLQEHAKVVTVWRSQGTEAEVVIFDTVCAPPFRKPGRWFCDPAGDSEGARLLNVAVTRTKERLYVIAHSDHLTRNIPTNSFASGLLHHLAEQSVVIDSRDLTLQSLPDEPMQGGGFPVLTFPSGVSAVFDQDGFVRTFADDVRQMPPESVITIFSPFLSENSVAHWGPHLHKAIERGCHVQILTRTPSRQSTFLSAAGVQSLIDDLVSIGAEVGYDNYIRGQKPMHHKLAILRFPRGGQAPIIWKGSMNALGHYNSEELMDRSQSQDLYECVSGILKLDQLQSAMRARQIKTSLENVLRAKLGAVCPQHKVPMLLKFGRNARYRAFFMSCPRWQEGCGTINVELDVLNAALRTIGARCTRDSCDAEIAAGRGKNGVYLRCSEGHFTNLD